MTVRRYYFDTAMPYSFDSDLNVLSVFEVPGKKAIARIDGSALKQVTLSAPANGLVSYNPCAQVPENTYGAVELTLDKNAYPTAKPPVAWLYREGDQYRFPTPVQ